MKKLEELQAEARRIGEEIYNIETAEKVAERRKLVGKTFRCRNNYSCPEKPSDYWWHWFKVTACDDEGALTAFSFQVDTRGEIMIQPAGTHHGTILFRFPVATSKFNAAWREIQKRVAKAQP